MSLWCCQVHVWKQRSAHPQRLPDSLQCQTSNYTSFSTFWDACYRWAIKGLSVSCINTWERSGMELNVGIMKPNSSSRNVYTLTRCKLCVYVCVAKIHLLWFHPFLQKCTKENISWWDWCVSYFNKGVLLLLPHAHVYTDIKWWVTLNVSQPLTFLSFLSLRPSL